MRSISLRSPAKLNLFLKVINKRPDGYHNLETLFERIDLCDDIQLKLNTDGAIRVFCDHPDVPTDSQNLVYRAAELLRDDFALANGVDIKITKRIPVAAGLGGGSSNAATTLLGLSQLWKLDLTRKELLACAGKIGSDVSFFLYDCSWALGTGRGECIKKLNLTTQLWHTLVVPPIKLTSRDVFGTLQHMNVLTKPNDDVNIFTRSLRKNDFSAINGFLRNDLERAILKLCPNLSQLKEKFHGLNPGAVLFSGSGPALFSLTRTQKEAEDLKSILKEDYTQVFAVRTF